jgi:hypothetical protein
LYRKVEEKRALPSIEESSSANGQIDEEHLFQLMLDAVSIREIQKIRRHVDLDDDKKTLEAMYEISSYVESSGVRARREIFEFLDDVASGTRDGMSPDIARAVARAAYGTLPIRNLRFPSEIPISDHSDMHVAFVELWSVLEKLTATLKAQYDTTIKRTVFRYKDRDLHN